MTEKKKTPKVPVASREKAVEENRQIRGRNRGQEYVEVADWGSVAPGLLADAIAAVSNRKCAIQFGYTRDGGAYYIRIVGDGDPYNEFVRPTEDIEKHLQGLILDFGDMS